MFEKNLIANCGDQPQSVAAAHNRLTAAGSGDFAAEITHV